MITIAQETPKHDDVERLLRQSDAFTAALYPPESRYPVDSDTLGAPTGRFFVARINGRAIGCGALILGDDGRAEMKRVFVDPGLRGKGVGTLILTAIEDTARREGVCLIQLETGIYNYEALHLYRRFGYQERGPFGSYGPDPFSVFLEKSMCP